MSTVITATACFVVGEAWWRLAKIPLTLATERNAALEYEVSLFSRNQFPQRSKTIVDAQGQMRYQLNELGYRGRSFAIPKPKDRIRVVVVGGAAAFDIDAPPDQDWPHLVETALQRAGHANVEVINAAVPGYATWDVLGRLYAEIWMIEPDYVLVYEAWNDIKYFPWLTPQHSLAREFRPPPSTTTNDGVMVSNPFIYSTGPLDRLLCHSQLYTHLRRRYWWWRLGEMGLEGLITGPKEQAQDPNGYPDTYSPWGPRQYELNLRLIAAAARDIGATPVLLTQARLITASNSAEDEQRIHYDFIHLSHAGLLRAFADCDAAAHSVAAAEQLALLDLGATLSGRSELFVDHVHTSIAGSREIAAQVAGYLETLLAAAHPQGTPDNRSAGAADS